MLFLMHLVKLMNKHSNHIVHLNSFFSKYFEDKHVFQLMNAIY